MIERIGNVLYWFACGVAALFAVGALFGYANHASSDSFAIGIILTIAAVLTWLAGRAALYILADR